MISKELLSKVLQHEVKYTGGVTDNRLLYCGHDDKLGTGRDYYINIYELAHKCKEWAFDKHNRYLKSYPSKSYDGEITYTCEIVAQSGMHIGTFPGMKSEPEAIFKACEWILQQIEKDNK